MTDVLQKSAGAFVFYAGSYAATTPSVWVLAIPTLILAVLLTVAVFVDIFC